MMHATCRFATLFLLLIIVACTADEQAQRPFDLVVRNGRVIDPESGLDAVREIGIRDGRIEAISESALAGDRSIDASGLVVAPGFIDLHEHGQSDEAYQLMVRDGVTSAFELEVGTRDIDAWYGERADGRLVNHGVSIGHIPVRMAVLGDPGTALLPAGIGGSGSATEEQILDMISRIETGLAQGAVAVGFGSAYTPGAGMQELERMFRVAAAHGATVHIHMRNGLAGLDSTIALAAATRAPLHIVHLNSSGAADTEAFLARIQAARAAGQDVTTEAYPYEAGMTEIQSALFDDWQSWPDERFAQHQWVATGERLTRESFARYRAQGGTVIRHERTEAMTRAAIASPLTMIASDGFIANGRGHPRTSGTFAKILGRYVRDENVVGLMDALRRMALDPARRLEPRVPAMANKGRIRVGADADLTLFDPATVRDRSTYEDATIPSEGIPYVIVNGTVVVDAGKLVAGVRPGRAIRAEVR
jgi:dihydroorotase